MDKNKWRPMMEPLAKTMEASLHRLTGSWNIVCSVCSGPMNNGAQEHLCGMKHYKAVWAKMGNTLPPGAIAGLDKKWCQKFSVSSGRVFVFNHLTGEHGLLDDVGQSVRAPIEATVVQVPPTLSPPKTNSSASQDAVSQSVQPSMVNPQSCAKGAEAPLVQTSQFAGHAVVFFDVESIGYMDALQTQGGWRAFMEPRRQHLEKALWDMARHYGSEMSCPVCDMLMTRGVDDHMKSKNHWKKLWDRIKGKPPGVLDAYTWDKPWVVKFTTPKGPYLFNLITGSQGLRCDVVAGQAGVAEVPPASTRHVPEPSMYLVRQSPLSAPATPDDDPWSIADPWMAGRAMPSLPVADVAARPAIPFVTSAPSPSVAASPPVELDFGHICWTRLGRDKAQQFEAWLQPENLPLECKLCGVKTAVNGFAEHVLSYQHYETLTSTCRGDVPPHGAQHAMAGNLEGFEQMGAPWIQTERVSDQTSIAFNHLTGAVNVLVNGRMLK